MRRYVLPLIIQMLICWGFQHKQDLFKLYGGDKLRKRQFFIHNEEFIDIDVEKLPNGKYMSKAISWDNERSYMYVSKDIRKSINESVNALLKASAEGKE
jgi:hypothetical protein